MSEIQKKTFMILIVDDEPKNIQLLANILNEEKYEFEYAMNGEEALNWISSKKFDLILLDIMMPDMDGFEVCKQIKNNESTKHIPVLFLTAKSELNDLVHGFQVGGSDYVTKPFQQLELLARIKVQAELKTLRGLIPICAKCKNIRDDDKGLWKEIETYIEENSQALFSHGLCPGCMKDLYGDTDWYKKKMT